MLGRTKQEGDGARGRQVWLMGIWCIIHALKEASVLEAQTDATGHPACRGVLFGHMVGYAYLLVSYQQLKLRKIHTNCRFLTSLEKVEDPGGPT